jgi:hypothetical protein
MNRNATSRWGTLWKQAAWLSSYFGTSVPHALSRSNTPATGRPLLSLQEEIMAAKLACASCRWRRLVPGPTPLGEGPYHWCGNLDSLRFSESITDNFVCEKYESLMPGQPSGTGRVRERAAKHQGP